jgi:hypothetical protein
MSLCIITTCMGRLQHVRRTAPLAAAAAPYIFVDWSCPDAAGDWVEKRLPNAHVVRVPGRKYFHKTRALNLGALRAMKLGYEYLCFADADTLIRPGALRWIERRLASDKMIIAYEHADLSGFLVVPSRAFVAVAGYDHRFRGWGLEDAEMRARLHLHGGLRFQFIGGGLLEAIAHASRLRHAHYRLPRERSAPKNVRRFARSLALMSRDGDVLERPNVALLLKELNPQAKLHGFTVSDERTPGLRAKLRESALRRG